MMQMANFRQYRTGLVLRRDTVLSSRLPESVQAMDTVVAQLPTIQPHLIHVDVPEEDARLAVLVVYSARRVALGELQRVGGHGDDSNHLGARVPH